MMYIVNLTSKECKKRDLPDDIVFHPVGIPPDARPLGEAVIGSNAGIKIGVTVDLWSGTSPRGNGILVASEYVSLMVCVSLGGRYMGVWTSVGCIPVSELHRLESGDILRQRFVFSVISYNYTLMLHGVYVDDQVLINAPLTCSFYDVALGDVPERFIPPSNCQ